MRKEVGKSKFPVAKILRFDFLRDSDGLKQLNQDVSEDVVVFNVS